MRYVPHHQIKGSPEAGSLSKPKRSLFDISDFYHSLKLAPLFFILLFSIIVPLFQLTNRPVAADSPPACTYGYSDDGKSIQRSNCSSVGTLSSPDATFTLGTSNVANSKLYVHQDGNCRQNILVRDLSKLTSGQLSGNITNINPQGQTVLCTTFDTVAVTIADTTNSVVDATPNGVVFSALQKLIDKECAASAKAGEGDNCDAQYSGWIDSCTTEATQDVSGDEKADQGRNWRTAFAACMATASKGPGQLTKAEVFNALDDNTYSKVLAAQDASAGDDKATCENSGGALSWIMCSIIADLASAVDGIYGNVIMPLLTTKPLDFSTDSPIYKGWSNFRIYGDIFLVLAVLAIVFGESIGGGLIEAYTVKKVLPRILIAAVAINLSIYLVAVAVDVTNVLGKGMSTLLLAPFGLKDGFDLAQHTAGSVTTEGLGLSALVGGGIWAAVHAGAFLDMFIFSVVLPALFIFLAIMITLFVRKALIIVLTMASPVAFALYCLPNTEKYFKRWWDLLIETLLVFPIISVLFAMGKVLAATIDFATNNPLTPLLEIIAIIIPLIGVPFAFKLAGGLLGRVHDIAQGARQKANGVGFLAGRRERAKQKFADESLMTQQKVYSNLNSRGRLSQFAARRVGGYNMDARVSAMNARIGKEMQDQNNTGDDTEQRAYSVNKNMLSSTWRSRNASKAIEGSDWRNTYDKEGNVTGQEYRTLGGSWVSEGAVRAAYSRWGERNMSAQQWSLEHEMDKASTQEEQDYLANNLGKVTGGDDASWRMSKGQRVGMVKGAAFSKQNVNRQWKHYGVDDDGNLKMATKNRLALFREIDEKQGNYAQMQQNADTWTTMSEAMTESRALLSTPSRYATTDTSQAAINHRTERAQAEEILQRGSRIAFSTRSGSMASTPISGSGTGSSGAPVGMLAGSSGREVGAGAAGRVQEEMIRFVNTSDSTAGAYQPPTPGMAKPAQAPEGPNDSIDRRRADRTGGGSPNGTGTGGVGPRSS